MTRAAYYCCKFLGSLRALTWGKDVNDTTQPLPLDAGRGRFLINGITGLTEKRWEVKEDEERRGKGAAENVSNLVPQQRHSGNSRSS